MKNVDFVIYGDTDSMFVNIGYFLNKNIGDDWKKLPEDKKIFYIRKVSSIISDYVNDRSYKEVQRKHYNCLEDDFRIKFKQEIIARRALFVMKKKYSLWCIDEEGISTDKIKTTGLEIVRSETPEAIKPILTEIMEMILKGVSDDELSAKISNYKKDLYSVRPEEIAVNIGVSHIEKFMNNGSPVKGTPWHVKGAMNYRTLIRKMNLQGKYRDIAEGSKVKVVYLKKNEYKFDSIAFYRWPEEFDNVLKIDYDKMIEKHFISKIQTILEPINKQILLNHNNKQVLDALFQ